MNPSRLIKEAIVIGKPAIETVRETDSTAESFSLIINSDFEGMPTINMFGEIDLFGAPKVYAMMWQASQSGRHSLIVNMEALDFMDSSGLQALLRLREKLRSRKQNIYLVGAKPQIKKLFQLTGFDKIFPVLESADEINTA
jgi:anti-sigma B factor antagonist